MKTHPREIGEQYYHWCPGCKTHHRYTVRRPGHPVWTFNGNLTRPSFVPSMNINGSLPKYQCHYYVTDGKIIFQGDCYHELKGKTVLMQDIALTMGDRL